MLDHPQMIYATAKMAKMIAPTSGFLYPTTTNNSKSAVGIRCMSKSKTT